MGMTEQSVAPIAKGYAYAIRVRVTGDEPVFPVGCSVRTELRDYAGANALAAALSTVDGSIVRIDDDTVELRIPGEGTAKIGNSTATFDLVRSDLQPEVWLGVQVTLPVMTPVTEPAA